MIHVFRLEFLSNPSLFDKTICLCPCCSDVSLKPIQPSENNDHDGKTDVTGFQPLPHKKDSFHVSSVAKNVYDKWSEDSQNRGNNVVRQQ